MNGGEDETLIEVRNLSFQYDRQSGREVLSHVDLEVCPGDVLTLLGPNGAGKSTLLNCIGNQLIPTGGTVSLCGTPLHRLSPREVAVNLGYVSQLQNMSFDFLVRDYLVLGRAPHIGYLKTPGYGEYQIVEQVLEELQITQLGDKPVSQLSGGERQQVQIARALVQRPRVILLDEPANHLDLGNQLKILQMILHLARDNGMGVILTSHTPDHAILLGGKVGILRRNGTLRIGTVEQIVTAEALSDIYGTNLHMVYVDEVGRMACLAENLEDAGPAGKGVMRS